MKKAAGRIRESAGTARGAILDRGRLDALLVDLDGVVTDTAALHAAAWKTIFDEFLRQHSENESAPFRSFDIESDYRRYVDGKPRYDGVRDFLASRGIRLPEGTPDDAPGHDTVCALGNSKNERFEELLASKGVAVYDAAVRVLRQAKAAGFKLAVISSSKNCAAVLDAAHLLELFDTRVDGVEGAKLGLRGKPAPDYFLEAARRLGVAPTRAAVIEDAVAGVRAGRAGGFALVVGVGRDRQAAALKENGADTVTATLAELEIAAQRESVPWPIPSALEAFEEIDARTRGRRIAVFLDYDGTLTPIVDRPEYAVLSEDMRETVDALTALCPVAVISGRERENVERLVGLASIVYAGSHGFDIAGSTAKALRHEAGARYIPAIHAAAEKLRERLGSIEGVIIEDKTYAVAVHYRLVPAQDLERVERAVDEVLANHPGLRKTGGKKVYELRPELDWNKGKAVLWLLEALGLDGPDIVPFYLGDDLTDEDAFAAFRERGIGILVAQETQPTQARYRLANPAEVRSFLRKLAALLEGRRA